MAATKRRKVSERETSEIKDEYANHLPGTDNDEEDEDPVPDPNTDGDDPNNDEEEDLNSGDVEGDEDDIAMLLEPLTREQLVSLLRSAAAADPNTLAEIRRLADLDPSHRKIFVHGLNWSTSADTLRSFFAQYGDIEDCRVVTDRVSGKSKGYGFVLFRLRSSARAALSAPQKLIDNRMTACQLASTGPSAAPPPPSSSTSHHHHHHHHHSSPDTLSRKIYVGNVHSDIDGTRLHEFFSRYGEIEEGPLGFDRQTGRPKGFALFIYRTQESARKALEEPNKNFDGHLLYCQRATDGQRSRTSSAAAGSTPAPSHGGGGGGGSGGGGGYVLQPPPGFAVPTGGGYNGMMDMGTMTQGLVGGPMAAAAFGQGMPANAALAMLAAAGQNPAAYGVPPALFASLNPALAAAMTGAAQPVQAMQAAVPAQGYGMASAAGYQNAAYQVPAQAVSNQGGVTYQAVPITQTPTSRSQMGTMSGYGQH